METTHNILDVTQIEPRLKHPTIFARFDELVEGEHFIILNDHDPKPLYYQLLGERGNIFTWEYLEQGPEWWQIKISKRKPSEGAETLGEIAAKDLRKVQVFKKYGLDFYCDGKKTMKEACAEKGLDVKAIEKELEQSDSTQNSRPPAYNEWGLDFLSDYIVNTHNAYIKKNLPDMRTYAEKVKQVHGKRHAELIKVHELVEVISAELVTHMLKEEQILFPYIKHLVLVKKGVQSFEKSPFESIKTPIHRMEMEHESVGNNLRELRKCTYEYRLPEDACASYSLLYGMLDELEENVQLHVHLENNILFPKSIDLEKLFHQY